MEIPKAKLAELTLKLKSEHGEDIHLLTTSGEQLIARSPTRAEFTRFVDESSETKRKARALETLTRACVLYPDAEALDALLEKRPGIGSSVAIKLVEIAGADQEVEAKKL